MSLQHDRLGVNIGSSRTPRVPGGASRYAVAIGAIGAALLFRYSTRASLGSSVPYLQFYPAILVAAWYGGLGPGVLATAVSALMAIYFLLPPDGFAVSDGVDQLSLAVFAATGLAIAWANLLSQDPSLRDVEVEVDGWSPPVAADADMLKIAFQNLLLNSAHAMKGRGRIRVAIEAVDASCHIAFIDGGPGIPPDVRDKIFTPFFTTKSRGSGLGLPTANRLIEAHQVQLAVDCPPTGGTTVHVQLPIAVA